MARWAHQSAFNSISSLLANYFAYSFPNLPVFYQKLLIWNSKIPQIAHSNIYGSAFFLIFQYRKVENRVSIKVTAIVEFQAKVCAFEFCLIWVLGQHLLICLHGGSYNDNWPFWWSKVTCFSDQNSQDRTHLIFTLIFPVWVFLFNRCKVGNIWFLTACILTNDSTSHLGKVDYCTVLCYWFKGM